MVQGSCGFPDGQGGAFNGREDPGFTPGGQYSQLLGADSGFAGQAVMQVQAVRAAVELGNPDADQLHYSPGQASGFGHRGDLQRQAVQRPPAPGIGFVPNKNRP